MFMGVSNGKARVGRVNIARKTTYFQRPTGLTSVDAWLETVRDSFFDKKHISTQERPSRSNRLGAADRCTDG